MSLIWTLDDAKERKKMAITPIVRALNLLRRVPDHLRKLDLAVDDEATGVMAMAIVHHLYGACDRIRRPKIARLWRERWPSAAEVLTPSEIVALFELEPLMEMDE